MVVFHLQVETQVVRLTVISVHDHTAVENGIEELQFYA